ncbi:MAG: GIY-YIG nuclease family protein [Patescibacteria group bacterium]
MFIVYAIYNDEKEKIYIGHTEDLINRIKRHNNELPNKIKSYTSKNKGEWILVHKEEYNTRQEATKREKQLKSYQGRKFIWQIINKNKK